MRAVPEWADGIVTRLARNRAVPARYAFRTPCASGVERAAVRLLKHARSASCRSEAVEMSAQVLDGGDVAAQHRARLRRRETRFTTDVTHRADERRGIESAERAHARRRGDVVAGRSFAVQT